MTPQDKGAGAVQSQETFRASESGDRILYSATSPFEGFPAQASPLYTRYLAARAGSGWENRAVDPPWDTGTVSGLPFANMLVLGSSPNLRYALVVSTQALTAGATQDGGNLYMQDLKSGSLTLVATSADGALATRAAGLSGALSAKFVSDDGQSALFTTGTPLTPGAPTDSVLYSWEATRGIRAESVLPDDEGGATVAGDSVFTSDYGVRGSIPTGNGLAHVYFSSFTSSGAGGVYVRTNGVSRAVSVSRIAGDPDTPVPAKVDAVGEDGRYLLFHTRGTDRLTPDTPATLPSPLGATPTFLYRYDAASDSLTYVGADADPGMRGEDSAVQMTQDGQTVAFQSVLSLGGEGTDGVQNLYVWRNGAMKFVASADPGSSANNAQTYLRLLSPSGRYFSFTDDSITLAQQFGSNNVSPGCPPQFGSGPGPCSQVYLYDADGAGLSCVSCREDGLAPRGRSGDPDSASPGFIRMDAHQAQTVIDDGTVFFTSADDLLPQDGNGANDVYASHNGQLRLLSRGTQGASARFLDASPDGKTVFFATNDPMVGTDADRAVDIYMTREGAGFSYTAPPNVVPCSASDCRGPANPVVPSERPGSEKPDVPAGNPKTPAARRATVRVKGVKLVGRKLRLTIRTSVRGRLGISGSGLRTATRSSTAAESKVVTVSLAPKAARALRRKGRIALRIRVSLTPPFGRSAVSTYRRTLRS